MGIFEFTRPDNYNKISEEWQIFESIFPDTGAFKYLPSKKIAYLDDNTYTILRLEKKFEDGLMSEEDFFDILKKITLEPIYNMRHVYNYRCGKESFWIKVSMIEKDGEWLGFIKDMTAKMQDIAFSEAFSIYDSVTRLNNREAFLEELRIHSETRNIEEGCLAIFHINGINHMNKILGIDNSKKCISCASRTVSHFASDDIIIGSTPYHEFLVFFKNKSEYQSMKYMQQIAKAVHETRVTDDFGEALIPGSDKYLSLNCGYSVYPNDSEDFNKLVNYAGFALSELVGNTTGMIKKFERNTYEKEREYYTDSQIFCRIIEENLFEYHMQPIVNAKTGAVFGYEALMRTTGNKYLNPIQMLNIAKKQQRMYDIERSTFFNVMKILDDNVEMFRNKKLFINCITDHMLTDEDFDILYNRYSGLMDRVVVEITEQADLTDDFINRIAQRRERAGFELAFDDYGTGYSNTANLIRCNPDYIKIDRSLITNIDTDSKRRQLVGAVTSFAAENDIKILAEGIETSSELSTVINLGVDLIQGYYTSRPKPFILYEISREVRNEILNYNASKYDNIKAFCIKKEVEVLKLDDVNMDLYNEIIVRQNKIKLIGEPARRFNASIIIDDDTNCEMTICDLFMNSPYGVPAIAVGENSSLTLIVEGENNLRNLGISVPSSASLIIKGNGILRISSEEDCSYAIGCDMNDSYGDITVDMNGTLAIDCNGLTSIAIGGGSNSYSKKINLESGDISIVNTGKICVSVGNIEGNSIISIGKNCNLNIENSSIENVSIGSLKKSANIISTGNIRLTGSGSNVLGIGVLKNGTGTIDIKDSDVYISFGAKNAFCIGTNGGNMTTTVENTSLRLSAGGLNTSGIGDSSGGGTISLKDNDITIKLNGERTLDIGSYSGSVLKSNNKIDSKINF